VTDEDTATIQRYRQLLVDAVRDEHVDAEVALRLIRRRRRAVRIRRSVGVAAIAVAVGAAVFAVTDLGATSHRAKLRPATSVPLLKPSPNSYAPAKIEHIELPPGYALYNNETSQVPTGTSAKITSVDARYMPASMLGRFRPGTQGELLVTLQTGDVAATDLANLRTEEPTAHYVDIRPGVSVILARDDTAHGGISYYVWFEDGVYVEVGTIDGPVPDLAHVVQTLRFEP
jgi:hypothetical protein